MQSGFVQGVWLVKGEPMLNPSDQPPSADDIAGSIRELTQEIRRLWQVVDELRDEVFADAPHGGQEPVDAEATLAVIPPLRLKSMPLDPCDPEFGRKINAADVAEKSAMLPERPRAATLNAFVARLTSESPAGQIGFNEWADGQKVESCVVVEVNDELFDWFADHFDAEYEAPGGAYVLTGDDGRRYVIWCNDNEIFLRPLTEAEAAEFEELLRIAEEKVARKREQFRDLQTPQKQQGCLW